MPEWKQQEFGVPVHITGAEESNLPKAATALPFKLAILIEYPCFRRKIRSGEDPRSHM